MMPSPWFRELYNDILNYRKYSLFYDVLTPWMDKALQAVDEMKQFKTYQVFDSTNDVAQRSMWNLYALSRVNDLLLMSFQPSESNHKEAPVYLSEYEAFFTKIGFTVVVAPEFAPFHHEIVQVHQLDEDDEPIGLYKQLWPELMFGDMLFSRSGVTVVGGRNHINKEVAERSTLYFAHRRKQRKTHDRSIGWGSNSQWRTNFRRDYQIGKYWLFNADGKNDLSNESMPGECTLTTEQRIELCKNRCFIVSSIEDEDLWPYYDRLQEVAHT